MVTAEKITMPEGKLMFGMSEYWVPVIEGKVIDRNVYETHDQALLGGIGLKYDGLNSQFCKFAVRMLGIESEWSK